MLSVNLEHLVGLELNDLLTTLVKLIAASTNLEIRLNNTASTEIRYAY